MSTTTRRPHNLSAPWACYVKLDYVRGHLDAYQHVRTPEDIRYVVGLLRSVDFEDIPRAHEFVDRVSALAHAERPVRAFLEDKIWIAELERWLAARKRLSSSGGVRSVVEGLVLRVKAWRIAHH